MTTKITSHRQSGGVTGHTVTISGNSQTATSAATDKPMGPWKKVAVWGTGAVSLAASAVGILQYFGINLLG